jgi:hypothetical protein
MAQSGDTTRDNGTGGESIYEGGLINEQPGAAAARQHDARGLLRCIAYLFYIICCVACVLTAGTYVYSTCKTFEYSVCVVYCNNTIHLLLE